MNRVAYAAIVIHCGRSVYDDINTYHGGRIHDCTCKQYAAGADGHVLSHDGRGVGQSRKLEFLTEQPAGDLLANPVFTDSDDPPRGTALSDPPTHLVTTTHYRSTQHDPSSTARVIVEERHPPKPLQPRGVQHHLCVPASAKEENASIHGALTPPQ